MTISMKEELKEEYKDYYYKIKDLSQKFSSTQKSQFKKQSISVWESKSTKEYYSSNNVSIDLHLNKLIPIPTNILDVGCGVGRFFKLFNTIGVNITAIDKDPLAIAMCTLNNSDTNITLINNDFSKITIESESYDSVISYNALYHCKREDFFNCIDKIHKILKTNGYFLFTLKTLKNNGEALEGATNIQNNTFIGCNMPDFDNLHHFCDEAEIQKIEKMFSKVIHKDPIPVIKKYGEIVQAAGYYLILQK